MFRVLFLALALFVAPGGDGDALAKLTRDLQRLRDHKIEMQPDLAAEMRALVADVRLTWSVDPSRAVESATALLDVMGFFVDASDEPTRPSLESVLRDQAAEALMSHYDGPFARWLATDVLSLSHSQPIERRLAAVRIFQKRSLPSIKLALLESAHDHEPRVRSAALSALVGWSDDSVHALFLSELERSWKGDPKAAGRLAEKHFSTVRFGEKSRFSRIFSTLVGNGLASEDWRVVTRAITVSTPLDNEAVVPFLIEALAIWKHKAELGMGAMRIRLELQRALRDRSGRSLGVEPEEWRAWWALVKSGKVKTGSLGNQGAGGESTEATFFGIRPRTDRLVFVIDRSGSMMLPFGIATTAPGQRARRRWDEAKNQLLSILDAMGPKTRFNVVIFHDFAEGWRDALAPATKDNLRSLREWLNFQKPNGGTQLRSGVDRALQIGPDGTVDLAKLEADTVVILCDGETAEGPGWVDGFLAGVNSTARILFHGVQVGGQGDATMSKLARGTRGDFVRIDG